jgi:hypothetical protein
MGETLINLVVELLAGVIGGNAAAAAFKEYGLGMLGNTITGAVGGGVIGQALQALLPSLAGTGGLDIGALLAQIVGGGAGGAILTIIAGAVKSAMAGPQVR